MPLKHKILSAAICFLAVQLGTSTVFPAAANVNTDPVLGVAGNYQIVSGTAISLGASLTGLDIGNTSTSPSAVSDLRSAIASLSATPATSVPADLGGKTYLPGAYAAVGGAAFAVTSSIILDGKNDCNSKFIFITPAAMNTTAGISVTLINSAKPNNVFWVVGGAVTTAASSTLSGNFLSSAAITVGASSAIDGRFLAMGAATVGASVIFQGFPVSGCSAPVGGLSISVPESVGPRNLDPGESATIELGDAIVTDTRGNGPNASWSVTTICSEFRDGSGNLLGCENFAYTFKEMRITGGLVISTHALASMRDSALILGASSGEGINSATWIPVITVSVPINQIAGIYTGSITHSVF